MVITGAAGFLGLALTRAFARAGHPVLALDHAAPDQFRPRPGTPTDCLRYQQVDITDRAAVLAAVGDEAAVLVHAAALTPGPTEGVSPGDPGAPVGHTDGDGQDARAPRHGSAAQTGERTQTWEREHPCSHWRASASDETGGSQGSHAHRPEAGETTPTGRARMPALPGEETGASKDARAPRHGSAAFPGEMATGGGADPERLLDTNLGGTLNLLAAARRVPGRTFIYISSAAVHDQERQVTLREEDAGGGSSLYGAAKLAAELLVQRYAALFDLTPIIVRPTSLYGPGEWVRPSRPAVTPVRRLLDAARRGQPVRIERGEARGDWLFVDDAAEAVLRLAAAGQGGVFNLSTGRPRPFSDLVRAVEAALPLTIDPDAEIAIDGGSDHPAIIANHRLHMAIDWQPCDLHEGIARTVRAEEES